MEQVVIKTGQGSPIFVVPRPTGGVLIVQGTSHIVASIEEIRELIAALENARIDA